MYVINEFYCSRIFGVIGCKFIFVLPYCNKKLELGVRLGFLTLYEIFIFHLKTLSLIKLLAVAILCHKKM